MRVPVARERRVRSARVPHSRRRCSPSAPDSISSISCCISGARNLRCSGKPRGKRSERSDRRVVGMQCRAFAVEDDDRVGYRRRPDRLPKSVRAAARRFRPGDRARSCAMARRGASAAVAKTTANTSAAIAAGSQPNPQATSRQAASAASGQRAPNSRPATTARECCDPRSGRAFRSSGDRLERPRLPTKPRHCHNFPAGPAHRHPIACPRCSERLNDDEKGRGSGERAGGQYRETEIGRAGARVRHRQSEAAGLAGQARAAGPAAIPTTRRWTGTTTARRSRSCRSNWSSCRPGCRRPAAACWRLFEGRDAAGKGGTIAAIREYMNPRNARIRRADQADRDRARAMVFPALCQPVPDLGRTRDLRPLLVQPRRRRAGHGLLHARAARAASSRRRRASKR